MPTLMQPPVTRMASRPLSIHLHDPTGACGWWLNTLLEIKSLCGFSSFSSQAMIPSPGFLHLSHWQQWTNVFGVLPKKDICISFSQFPPRFDCFLKIQVPKEEALWIPQWFHNIQTSIHPFIPLTRKYFPSTRALGAPHWLWPCPDSCSINVGGIGAALANAPWLWEFAPYLLSGGSVCVAGPVVSAFQVDGDGALTSFDAAPSSALEPCYLLCARTCCARPKCWCANTGRKESRFLHLQ